VVTGEVGGPAWRNGRSGEADLHIRKISREDASGRRREIRLPGAEGIMLENKQQIRSSRLFQPFASSREPEAPSHFRQPVDHASATGNSLSKQRNPQQDLRLLEPCILRVDRGVRELPPLQIDSRNGNRVEPQSELITDLVDAEVVESG
jgi:hypothetical protein